MDTQKLCQNCQAPLAADAPRGLCPACLMKVAMGTATVPGLGQPGFVPPGIEELSRKFPQFEIIELIGRGGMGAVYKARQKELDRIVALKILPPGIGDDAAFAERFSREAKALAKLNHPGIITIHDFGRADGVYFFVMEFVDGVNLRQLLRSGRVSPREALAIVPQICDALQFAHDQGIVPRDIKPENILLDRRGRVKVADFGLAKLVGAGNEPAAGQGSASGSPALTDAGKVMGTPAYMAPEQAQHPGDVDHRADIYALGVVFYQMLTGELPGKPLEPPSRKVQIDVRLDDVVLRALEMKPELRYQQVSEVKTMVETIAGNPTVPPADRGGAPDGTPRLLPGPKGLQPMQRPSSVIVVGILNIVFGAVRLFMLIGGVTLLVAQEESMNPLIRAMHQNPVFAAWLKLCTPLSLLSHTVLLTAGIGLLCLKPWARTLSIAYSIYAIAFAMIGTAVNAMFLLQPMVEDPSHQPIRALIAVLGIGFVGCLGLIYPALTIVLLTRPKVVRVFRVSAPPRV